VKLQQMTLKLLPWQSTQKLLVSKKEIGAVEWKTLTIKAIFYFLYEEKALRS